MQNILLWQTKSRSTNAALCDVIPQWRYVLVTEQLLDELTPTQVEMVFLHEVDHAELRHSLKLMMAMVATLGGGVLFTASMFGSIAGVGTIAGFDSLVLVAAVLLSFDQSVGMRGCSSWRLTSGPRRESKKLMGPIFSLRVVEGRRKVQARPNHLASSRLRTSR